MRPPESMELMNRVIHFTRTTPMKKRGNVGLKWKLEMYPRSRKQLLLHQKSRAALLKHRCIVTSLRLETNWSMSRTLGSLLQLMTVTYGSNAYMIVANREEERCLVPG
jgi:hypothetical protein